MDEKKITFDYEGATYTLSFTRKTVQMLESQGFYTGMIKDKPATGIPLLFRGAFLAHHRGIKEDLTNKILNSITNRDELISALLEMYVEPINVLFSDPEEDAEKNVTWGKNF